MRGIQYLISLLQILFMVTIRMQRSVNIIIHDEVILIDKDEINTRG